MNIDPIDFKQNLIYFTLNPKYNSKKSWKNHGKTLATIGKSMENFSKLLIFIG